MNIKILILSTILSVCYSDEIDQALSTTSFVRKDVPLSYNSSQINDYATERSKNINRIRRPRLRGLNIQYAPVPYNEYEHGYPDIDSSKQKIRHKPREPHIEYNNMLLLHSPREPVNYNISGYNIALHLENLVELEQKVNKSNKIRDISTENYKKTTSRPVTNAPKKILPSSPRPIFLKITNRRNYKESLINNKQLQAALRDLNLQNARKFLYKLPVLSLNEGRSYAARSTLKEPATRNFGKKKH